MPIVQTPLEGLPPEEERELEEMDQEEENEVLKLLEGYSHSDLELWVGSPFYKVLLQYMTEQKENFSRILVEGTVTTEQPAVPGFVFRSDDALRGAVAFITELEDCVAILTEFLDEVNENYRDRLKKGDE